SETRAQHQPIATPRWGPFCTPIGGPFWTPIDYYENHDQLRRHLADFVNAYNFARRLKTLKGLTPYEYVCKIWSEQPKRFIREPHHQNEGLNT
ncbi:IS3 family transposase, partial [Sphingosinicella soli]|uniref:IS3 family transposase n=1 Tax=Sphingosinicella soli TaxID=333708 RepID=UPI001FB10D00